VRPPRGPDRADGSPPSQAQPARRADRPGRTGQSRVRRVTPDRDGPPPSALVAAPAELEPPARVEALARLRRLRELPARLSERERLVLARVLAGASLADAGAGLGATPTKLADNALTRARRKARDLLALEDAA